MHYLYRYLDKDTIINVGITDNLLRRYNEHKTDEWYNDELKFEFIELNNKFTAYTYETYLINTYKPKYNTAQRGIDVSLIDFKFSPLWQPIDVYESAYRSEKTTMDITYYKKKLQRIKNQMRSEYEKKLQRIENQIRSENMLEYILYNYKDNIIHREYNEYEQLVITFDSKDARDLVDKIELRPKVVDHYEYDIKNENIVSIAFLCESYRGNDPQINEKYNQICILLEIDKYKLDIKEGVRKKQEQDKLKLLNCIDKINRNYSFTFINHTHNEKKITINDFMTMNNGLKYCIYEGHLRSYIYNNKAIINVYFDKINDIQVKLYDNEWCVKEADFFDTISYELYEKNIPSIDPYGNKRVIKP